MQKINRHIEIAHSTNISLSSLSQVSCEAIYALLRQHYASVGVTTVNNLDDLKQLVAKQPDLVFMGLKFIHDKGQTVWVSDYLEARGITHTGSPKAAIEYECSKSLAKLQVRSAGLSTADFALVEHGINYQNTELNLRYPLFVKPASLGGGAGVDDKSIVYNQSGLMAKIQQLSNNFASDILIEEYLPGREFSVAILKDPTTNGLLAMPIEMIPGADINGDMILSQALKSGELETPVISVSDRALRQKLCDLAEQVFLALGARDYGRIDLKLDAHGQPHFIEANLIPGLIKGSGNFPKACLINENIDYDEMILRIVDLGLQRVERNIETYLA